MFRMTALAAVGCVLLINLAGTAQATVLMPGQSARIDFAPGSSGPGTPPFSFIALDLVFSSANPFGPNESLSYAVYSPDKVLLGSGTALAGSSVYTSGLFATLTESVFPASPLNTTSFYATVTDLSGSFDLIGGEADLYNFSGGSSEFAATGTLASAVPEPATWTIFLLGLSAIGWTLRSIRPSEKEISVGNR